MLFPDFKTILYFKVVISAEVPLDSLFCAERQKGVITDDERMLMDDLKISPVSVTHLTILRKMFEEIKLSVGKRYFKRFYWRRGSFRL